MDKRKKSGKPYLRIQVAMLGNNVGLLRTPDLEMVDDCFQYWLETQEPLPNCLMELLSHDIKLLLSGRDGLVLKKTGSLSNNPNIDTFLHAAVSYVKTCRRYKYDENPVMTVCEKYEITRQTYYRWNKRFPDAPSDIPKHLVNAVITYASNGYKVYRISKKENVHPLG